MSTDTEQQRRGRMFSSLMCLFFNQQTKKLDQLELESKQNQIKTAGSLIEKKKKKKGKHCIFTAGHNSYNSYIISNGQSGPFALAVANKSLKTQTNHNLFRLNTRSWQYVKLQCKSNSTLKVKPYFEQCQRLHHISDVQYSTIPLMYPVLAQWKGRGCSPLPSWVTAEMNEKSTYSYTAEEVSHARFLQVFAKQQRMN